MIGGSQPLRERDIFSKFSQEEIFEFAGIPVTTGSCTNPLRKDTNPGCNFSRKSFKTKEILFFCDPSRFFGKTCITCIEAVMFVHNLEYRNALEYIYNNCSVQNQTVVPFSKKNSILNIYIKPRKWKTNDYLIRHGFDPLILTTENIYPVSSYWVDFGQGPKLNPVGNPSHVTCIASIFKSKRVKLYFPERVKRRFYTNCVCDDFWGEYYAGDKIFVTKSLKDYLVLKYICHLDVIGVQTEQCTIPKLYGYNKVIILFDNDSTGIIRTLQEKERTGYESRTILLPYSDPFEIYEAKGAAFTKDYFQCMNF